MAKNGVEVIILDKMKWLNEIHIEQQMCHSALRNITAQYPLHLRKQTQELQECIKQPYRKFLRADFAVQIIMDCRTIPVVNFKSRLRFNQYDPIMTQEQSRLIKIKSAFSSEEIIFQHNVLG